MQRRTLFPVIAIALIGVLASCDDSTGIDENFQDDANWTATLSGASEVPAVNTSATGRAWFVDRGNTIDYYLEYNGLTSNAVNAHIHRGAAGTAPAQNVMIPLTFVRQASGVAIGTIDMTVADVSSEAGTQSPADIRAALTSGDTYVNVHSANFTGGEIRGQITPR